MASSSSASAEKQQSGPSADGEVTPPQLVPVFKSAVAKPKLKYVPVNSTDMAMIPLPKSTKCNCKGDRQKVFDAVSTLGYEKALEKHPALMAKAKKEGWLGRKFFVKACNGKWRVVGGKKKVVNKKIPTGHVTTEHDRYLLYQHMVASKLHTNGIEYMCRGIEFSCYKGGISCTGRVADFIDWLRKANKEGWLTHQLAVTPTGADHKIPVRPKKKKRSREEMVAAAEKRRKVLTSEVERLRAEAESASKELEMFELAEDLAGLREAIAQRKAK